jgi:hypothetical protein
MGVEEIKSKITDLVSGDKKGEVSSLLKELINYTKKETLFEIKKGMNSIINNIEKDLE